MRYVFEDLVANRGGRVFEMILPRGLLWSSSFGIN